MCRCVIRSPFLQALTSPLDQFDEFQTYVNGEYPFCREEDPESEDGGGERPEDGLPWLGHDEKWPPLVLVALFPSPPRGNLVEIMSR